MLDFYLKFKVAKYIVSLVLMVIIAILIVIKNK